MTAPHGAACPTPSAPSSAFSGQPHRKKFGMTNVERHNLPGNLKGKQGAPSMPAVFEATPRRGRGPSPLAPNHHVVGVLDDVYSVTPSHRARPVLDLLRQHLATHARSHLHQGKTRGPRISSAARAKFRCSRGPLRLHHGTICNKPPPPINNFFYTSQIAHGSQASWLGGVGH